MEQQAQQLDHDIIVRYTDQPARLPTDLRGQIEQVIGGPVLLYALTDLDHALTLTESWLAVGTTHVALARRASPVLPWDVRAFRRERITAMREAQALSGSTLTLFGEPGEPPLAVLRYTHRQRRAVENIRFVLDEALEARTVPTGDAAMPVPTMCSNSSVL